MKHFFEKIINLFHQIREKIDRLVKFVREGIWELHPTALPPARRCLVRTLRVITMTISGCRRHDCALHASRLTFTALLSIIPVLALALTLAKAVTDESELRIRAKDFVHEYLDSVNILPAPQVDVGTPEDGQMVDENRILEIVDSAFDIVERLNFRALGGVGLLLLLWAVISLLSGIERSFNTIWGVTENRTLLRRFTDYLSIVVIVPFVWVAASSIPVFNKIQNAVHEVETTGSAAMPVLRLLVVLTIMSAGYCFLLRAMPNTKVRLRPGLCGAVVAAIGSMVWVYICLKLQIGVARYNALFGSFALVPILLFWVLVSWEIVVIAAEISYAAQHVDDAPSPSGELRTSMRIRIHLAHDMLSHLSAAVSRGEGILDLAQFNSTRPAAARFTAELAGALVREGILAPVADKSGCYTTLVDLKSYSMANLVNTLLCEGIEPDALKVDAIPDPDSLPAILKRSIAATHE